MSLIAAMGLGLAAMALVMAWLWYRQLQSQNAGYVDVAWAYGVGAMGAWLSCFAGGDRQRRALIAVLALLWSLRLGTYLLRRVSSRAEDSRYRHLRESWGRRAKWKYLGFFQLQATWTLLFALPILAASGNPHPLGGWSDWIGGAIWLVAVIGESAADWQLSRFRACPENEGRVFCGGLWRYSRHPNYFFEWVLWFSWVFLGWSWPWGFLALSGPVIMLTFLMKITGIPPTEARVLASRGAAYRDYVARTSRFFPMPPKRGATDLPNSS